jgi:hypothetical protein
MTISLKGLNIFGSIKISTGTEIMCMGNTNGCTSGAPLSQACACSRSHTWNLSPAAANRSRCEIPQAWLVMYYREEFRTATYTFGSLRAEEGVK